MSKIFKVKNGLSPEPINDVFDFIKKPYSLRTNPHFRLKRIRITKYVIETPCYLGPKLWNLVPEKYETIGSLKDFNSKTKTWVIENCPCMLCKTYIPQIGFL